MEEGLLEVTREDGETLEEKERRVKPGSTSRADTREELKGRLQAKLEELRANINVNDKKKVKKLKKKLARIEKNKKDSNDLKQKNSEQILSIVAVSNPPPTRLSKVLINITTTEYPKSSISRFP